MLYLFSGLGADERIFAALDLPGVAKKYVPWIPPIKGESLQDYCRRLSAAIDTSDEVILLGVSFGGIVAIEIAKQIPCKRVIVISSITSHRQMDWKMKLLRFTKLYHLVPVSLFKSLALLAADYFFKTGTKEERELRNTIIRDADERFLEWSIPVMFNWRNDVVPKNVVHIHGTRDRVFPISLIDHCIPIGGAEHFMIVNRGKEISRIVMEKIN